MQFKGFIACVLLIAVAGCGDDSGPAANREPAEVGIGQKSQHITGSGYLPTVVRARFRMEENLELSKARHALDLYKAANDGRGPQTHEEYMEKIIKENYVRLPKLPEGQRYQYDPETEELWVEDTGSAP